MIITATIDIILPGGRSVTIIMIGAGGIITTVRHTTVMTMIAGVAITMGEGVTTMTVAALAIMATGGAVIMTNAGTIIVPGRGLSNSRTGPRTETTETDSARRKNKTRRAWNGQNRRRVLIRNRAIRRRDKTRNNGSKKPESGRRSNRDGISRVWSRSKDRSSNRGETSLVCSRSKSRSSGNRRPESGRRNSSGNRKPASGRRNGTPATGPLAAIKLFSKFSPANGSTHLCRP